MAYFGRLTFKVTVIEDLLLADILELHLYLPVEADAAHCLDKCTESRRERFFIEIVLEKG